MEISPINFAEKPTKLAEHWSPRVVDEINDYQFKLVKVLGKFVWHKHDDTDEAFIVLAGEMEIEFRDGRVMLGTGEMYIPKGLEHVTRAARECHLLVVEPRGVVGDAGGDLMARNDVWL
jgi:mannose-6-phosphate isomerase-like protein (cupin superfamily)